MNSMILSQQYVEGLRDDVRSNPLAENEVRRIEGMGEMYFSLANCLVDKSIYTELYEVFVDDIGYKFYRKTITNPTTVRSV